MDEEKPTLVITLDSETNQVSVSGPIMNRLLSYAMLKLAEKAIDENYAQSKQTAIVTGNGGLPLIRR